MHKYKIFDENISERRKVGAALERTNQFNCEANTVRFEDSRFNFILVTKPENILVKGNICKVADFGLAREIRSLPPYTHYVSTRWYRAPEVILRSHHYGTPIDLFAIGLILAELYSLRPLFPGDSEIDQIYKIMNLLGPPSERTWRDGLILMKKKNLRISQFNKRISTGTMQQPSAVKDQEEIDKVELNLKKQMPPRCPPKALHLMRDLIQWNPISRPSAEAALGYDFFIFFSQTDHSQSGNKLSMEPVPPRGKKELQRNNEISIDWAKIGDDRNNPTANSERIGTQNCLARASIPQHFIARDGKMFSTSSIAEMEKLSQDQLRQLDNAEENEFSQYLSAIQTSFDANSEGDCINDVGKISKHSQLPGRRESPENKLSQPMWPATAWGDEALTSSVRNRNGFTTRRDRIARATLAMSNGASTKKKGGRSVSQIKHSQRSRKQDPLKPRWIISNQNLGKRAIEVHVKKTAPDMSVVGGDYDHPGPGFVWPQL